jgi:hypothetical protein
MVSEQVSLDAYYVMNVAIKLPSSTVGRSVRRWIVTMPAHLPILSTGDDNP